MRYILVECIGTSLASTFMHALCIGGAPDNKKFLLLVYIVAGVEGHE